MSTDPLYREAILDHYRHPRNYGRLESPDISNEQFNPLCGDQIRMVELTGNRLRLSKKLGMMQGSEQTNEQAGESPLALELITFR